jgi:heme a synthase
MGRFHRLTVSTLIAVYVLILVGGVVRSTGSGMGCPDWPKCFGSWVPPSSAEQLPEDYKEVYAEYRNKKNHRFAQYLRLMGMSDTADRLLNDKSVLQEADFNPAKTWIEYFNRIVGVIIGLMIIAVAIASLKLWAVQRQITIISFISLFLVVFQGWIGSFVVSTNLTPWTITVHMFLAMVLVALLVYLVHVSSPVKNSLAFQGIAFWWLAACIAVLLVQILLGTRVREEVDVVAQSYARIDWIAHIDETFRLHRSFSWIVLILHAGLILNLRKTQGANSFSLWLILLILSTILTGVGMAYSGVPPFLQPIHLLLATGSFGMQFLLLLKLKGNVKNAIAG